MNLQTVNLPAMKLQVCVPTEILIDEPVAKVIAEAANGSFCLLPRHTDFLTALVPGILMYEQPAGKEIFLANDKGVLVKQGEHIRVSVGNAIQADSLESLRDAVGRKFELLDERSRVCQSAIASLEANFLRRFLEFEKGLSP